MKNSFLILGEPFEFRKIESLIVDFDKKVIEINPEDPDHLRRLYRILKKRLLLELEPVIKEYSEKLGVEVKRISIKKQRSRWGSCSASGNLNFNLWLICLPREFIHYVAWHEVAHLREKNHGKAFRDLINTKFNYREMERRLKEYWSSIQKTNLFFPF